MKTSIRDEIISYLSTQLELPEVLSYIEENCGMMPIYIVDKVCELFGEFILELNCTEYPSFYKIELWQGIVGKYTITCNK